MTEYDRIKGLSLEELAEELIRPSDDDMYYVCSDDERYCIYEDAVRHQKKVLKKINRESTEAEMIEYALCAINDYLIYEFESNGDSDRLDDDIEQIAIGFTTITDDEIGLSAFVNLIDHSIQIYLDDYLAVNEKYDSLYDLIEEIESFDFEYLMHLGYCALEEYEAHNNYTPVCMDTSDLKIEGFDGTFRTIDHEYINYVKYWLMENEYGQRVVVDSRGNPHLSGNISSSISDVKEMLLWDSEFVKISPDNSITQEEMRKYGFFWGGMLPIRGAVASELYKYCDIYKLRSDNQADIVRFKDDIAAYEKDGFIFGVPKDQWNFTVDKIPDIKKRIFDKIIRDKDNTSSK